MHSTPRANCGQASDLTRNYRINRHLAESESSVVDREANAMGGPQTTALLGNIQHVLVVRSTFAAPAFKRAR